MNYFYRCLIIILSAVLLTSCEKDPASPAPDNPEIVTGTVITADTLSGTLGIENSPYIIRKRVTVPRDSTLVIKPGVKIYFKSSEADEDFQYDDLKVGMLEVNGYIKAEGKIDSTIAFSRANEKGHWGMIFIQSNDTVKSNIFNYCNLEYGNRVDGIQIVEPKFGIIMTNYSKIDVRSTVLGMSKTDGISCYYSSVVIKNCTVSENNDEGITCYNSTAEITNNILENNAETSILLLNNSSGTISENIINGKIKDAFSYGIYIYRSASSITKNIITNCTRYGIKIENWGDTQYGPTINIAIQDNQIKNNYAGICLIGGYKTLPIISGNVIKNNIDEGMSINTNWLLDEVVVSGNTIENNGEGIEVSSINLRIKNNIIKNNQRGGIFCRYCTNVIVIGNEFAMNGFGDNSYFAGIYIQSIDNPLYLINNLFFDNKYGIRTLYTDSIYINNCTIISNEVGLDIKGNEDSVDIIKNTIISGNETSFLFADSNFACPIELSYSLIQESVLAPELTDMGNNLYAVDPLFADAANNNYQLSATSPCIDMGTNAVDSLPEFDLLGNPRIIGASIDIGAYEFQGAGR
jgi:parallel beta-helix repeat protein